MELETVRLRLGWNIDRQRQLEELGDPTLVAARVGVEHRGAYGLLASEVSSARLSGRFRQGQGQGEADWPAVGDWVAVQPAAGGGGVIHQVLPRHSLLERLRPGARQSQVVAANVDVVFVVTSPGRDFNLRRVERYLAVVWASGGRPVVVLNKADLCDDAAGLLRDLGRVGSGIACLATSAASGAGVAELRAQVPPGATGAMVGSSGVGKSSLLNCLLGDARLATGHLRLTDGKGRHTTTRRELLELPGGGCLIDTPGMRELGLWEARQGIDQAFDDVEALAASCRFRDCRHQGEPGCAVAEAVARGVLADDRLASFEKLRREDAFQERQLDPRRQAASKGWSKIIHKQQRARRKVDPKLRDD
jgi:ribosome biogenesis GTPase